MRLTSKDLIGTALAATAVLVGFAVSYGWGWPLLSDYRAGTIALGIIGIGMCAAASETTAWKATDPFIVVASALGFVALALIVAGLIWATAELFVGLVAVIVLLWFVATARHIVRAPAAPGHPAVS